MQRNARIQPSAARSNANVGTAVSWPTRRVDNQRESAVFVNTASLQNTPMELSNMEATAVVAVAGLGFSLLSAEVVIWHALTSLDLSVHTFVASSVPLEVRQIIGGKLLSNGPIVAGWCAWAATALFAARKLVNDKSSRAMRHVAIATAMYTFGGGSVMHGDPFLVDMLKHIFQRVRPSPVHVSYAFPSGHTTSATFIIGTLIFVLFPTVLEATRVNTQIRDSSCASLQKQTFCTADSLTSVIQMLPTKVVTSKNRLLLWSVLAGTTAVGRVLADAHWTTDVLAGGCLGAALVGATAVLCASSDLVCSPAVKPRTRAE